MHVDVTQVFVWEPAGFVGAFCSACDSITVQRRLFFQESEHVANLKIVSFARGCLFRCSCGNVRCGDKRPAAASLDLAEASPMFDQLPDELQHKEAALQGLNSRRTRRRLSHEDRAFILASELLGIWSRLNHRRGGTELDRGTFRILGIGATIFAIGLSGFVTNGVPQLGWAAIALSVPMLGFGIWRASLRGIVLVEDELPGLFQSMRLIDASEEDLCQAIAHLKEAGFQHLRTLRASRLWAKYLAHG